MKLFFYRLILKIRIFFFFFPYRPIGQIQKYRLISVSNWRSFVYFMLTIGLFYTSLCVKWYGFVLKTKYFIQIFVFKIIISAFYSKMTEVLEFGKILVNDKLSCSKIFLNLCFLCPLQSINTEKEW